MKTYFCGLVALLHVVTSKRQNMIIDTDSDYDDVLSLLYATQSPEIELLLVTVSNTGFGDPLWAANLAKAVLDSVGADVPVANGTAQAVATAGYFPRAWLDQECDYLCPVFNVSLDIPQLQDAKSALIATLEAAEDFVDYVALGPQTDLAQAILDPVAALLMQQKVRRIVLSGGAFTRGGNVISSNMQLFPSFVAQGGCLNEKAECNIFTDAAATSIVCREAQRLGIDVVFMPLDSTETLIVTPEQIWGYADADPTSPLGLLMTTLQGFSGVMQPGIPPKYWDPAAVVLAASQDTICTTMLEMENLLVETSIGSEFDFGSFSYEEKTISSSSSHMQACTVTDYSAFLSAFWQAFGVQPEILV